MWIRYNEYRFCVDNITYYYSGYGKIIGFCISIEFKNQDNIFIRDLSEDNCSEMLKILDKHFNI